jgi:hypothetical protein
LRTGWTGMAAGREVDGDAAVAAACDEAAERRDVPGGRRDQNRLAGARDRGRAGRDRGTARSDRGRASGAAGSLELQREIDRARRTREPLVLVFLDGVGPKAVNDAGGRLDDAVGWRERLQSSVLPDRVTIGLAELHDEDQVHVLLQRADADPYRQR